MTNETSTHEHFIQVYLSCVDVCGCTISKSSSSSELSSSVFNQSYGLDCCLNRLIEFRFASIQCEHLRHFNYLIFHRFYSRTIFACVMGILMSYITIEMLPASQVVVVVLVGFVSTSGGGLSAKLKMNRFNCFNCCRVHFL